jgi:hypothetical protein
MAKKNDNTGLILAAIVIGALFLLPRRKKPIIVVHDLDKGEFLKDSAGPELLLPASENIDFLKPYRQNGSLAGFITC